MKVTEHIRRANGKALFSFEIIPPKKGDSIQELYRNIDPLIEFKPPFIDVTTSREEIVDVPKGDGTLEQKIIRRRPGTVGICASIMHKYKVDTVPHILCGGFTREETEYVLIDLGYLGIDNVLALRGDKMKNDATFKPVEGGHHYATELVGQIRRMNQGKYLYDDVDERAVKTDFCIGVAAYPEMHFESPDMDADILRLKEKVAAGADYIVTQMFFDNAKYFAFVERCRREGIHIPIIPGIKPIAVKNHLHLLPRVFHLDLPQELVREVEKCTDNEQVRRVGVEWAIRQSRELIAGGVPVVHFYSMGKSDNIYRIAKELF